MLGWASSLEPAELSPFKPKPSLALMRACNGLGLGFRYQKPEPRAQAWALIYCSLACRSTIGKVKYYSVSKNQFNSMKIKLGSHAHQALLVLIHHTERVLVRCRAGGENQSAASLQPVVSFEGWVWYKAMGIAISANRCLASMVSNRRFSTRANAVSA